MKYRGATVIAACLAGTAIALPTMNGPMFTNKQAQLMEMIDNNRGEFPMDEKTAQVFDNLMHVVRQQQAGMPLLGDATDGLSGKGKGKGIPLIGSILSGLLGAIGKTASGDTGALGNAVGLTGAAGKAGGM